MCTSNLLASNLHVPFRAIASLDPTSLEFALSYGLTPQRAGEREEYFNQLICTFLSPHKSFYPTAPGHIAFLVRFKYGPKIYGNHVSIVFVNRRLSILVHTNVMKKPAFIVDVRVKTNKRVLAELGRAVNKKTGNRRSMVDVVDGVETVGRMLGIKGPQKRTSKL
jgi:hypothetical protein